MNSENLDNRLWPRLAAIAGRLWSPADVRDGESIYTRLDVLTQQTEMQGFQPRSGTERLLPRTAGTDVIAALLTLAGAVEPVWGIRARDSQPFRSDATPEPLDRSGAAGRAS